MLESSFGQYRKSSQKIESLVSLNIYIFLKVFFLLMVSYIRESTRFNKLVEGVPTVIGWRNHEPHLLRFELLLILKFCLQAFGRVFATGLGAR